jgi:hypothetical protein
MGATSCVVGDVHSDLVRVEAQKLAGPSDIWLFVDQRATLHFIAVQAGATVSSCVAKRPPFGRFCLFSLQIPLLFRCFAPIKNKI